MKKETYIKLENIRTGDFVYSITQWPSKDIDGVEFIYVKKSENDSNHFLMRKDSLKIIK